MSIPSIPGYLGQDPTSGTLASLWEKPDTDLPVSLWPSRILRMIRKDPVDWVTIEQYAHTSVEQIGIGCILIDRDGVPEALSGTSWIGRRLGDLSVFGDGEHESGLVSTEGGVGVEFFVHARKPSGAPERQIEVSYPFLWYWDAYRVKDGWRYVDGTGKEHELVRYEQNDNSYKVEVRALELRQFLHACQRNALIQVDYVPMRQVNHFEPVNATMALEWVHLNFHAKFERLLSDDRAFSRLVGQYVITGLRTSRLPKFEEFNKDDLVFPEFIYAIEPSTGHPLRHTCDPDRLGTYFDKDNSRLHYLTPIYFRREVLQPYSAEPGRYSLSATRLSCLDLWGISLAFNSAGLVEVYLGDLGRDLPAAEWGHWLTYNVPPVGRMEESRFRRDFLGQWVGSPDPAHAVRQARLDAVNASTRLLGSPIWKALDPRVEAEFNSMIGPLSEDPAALGPVLLLLAKVLIDGIDPKPLKTQLGSVEPNERSLRLLQRFVDQLGDSSDVTAILRALYGFRSSGGVAHLASPKSREKAASVLGISGMSNADAFTSVATRVAECLNTITSLIAARLVEPVD